MKKLFLIIPIICFTISIQAQHSITFLIKSKETGEVLGGASVSISPKGRVLVADTAGIANATDLLPGFYLFHFSHAGMQTRQDSITIPFYGKTPLEIYLEPREEEEEEVIIQSTRTSRNIRNVPTRVETIMLEEIDEKSNMRPSNVAMLLHESTGIQVQQTSATSGNANIRIQGLDGRYTQLLKDGFPSFGNFASGLSVLEIPPLDLKQVEVIKGPASTLFGGGAIAGVVNFISRLPALEAEHNFLFNQSNIGQTNIGYFSSHRNKKVGYTLLGLVNKQQTYDVDDDDFTEVPKSFEFVLHPKLFIYPDQNTTLIIGNSFTKGNREGGDVYVIRGKADNFHTYFEDNNTLRNITTLEFVKKTKPGNSFNARQSFSIFDRHIRAPGYHFHGISYSGFTDLSYLSNLPAHSLVAGVNLMFDEFNEKLVSVADRDNRNLSAGAYVQDTWDASEKIKLESGLRLDWAKYSNSIFSKNELFVLPRASLMINFTDQLTSRIGGGIGYKVPTLFTERTETIQYNGLSQLSDVRSEKSYGGTADINFRTRLSQDWELSLNQLFFYSWIERPLVLESTGSGTYRFRNADQPIRSRGFETNAKFIYRQRLKLFLGYTFTYAEGKYFPGNQFLPLVPRSKLNSALIYEKHEFIKLGLEAYYTSPQYLYNGMRTEDFWELGFMAEKIFRKFSVFVNFENFTDTRQSKFKRVANDPHNNPSFDDIWTHTEGFVFNGGVKIRL
jgi:outer membrane receptor for ferrienterochelin and colicins